MNDSEDPVLYDFQSLRSIQRYDVEQFNAVGTFGYRGQKLIVHWEPEGFLIYGSTEEATEGIEREFESKFSFPEFYVSRSGADEFEKIHPYGYNLDWGFRAVKGVGKMFGFVATDNESTRFPDGENVFWVFSDDDKFSQVADSSRAVHDVFPELMSVGEEYDVLFEDVTDFAMARRDKVERK